MVELCYEHDAVNNSAAAAAAAAGRQSDLNLILLDKGLKSNAGDMRNKGKDRWLAAAGFRGSHMAGT